MKRLFALLLAGCAAQPAHEPAPEAPVIEVQPSMNAGEVRTSSTETPAAPKTLTATARETVAALSERDIERLAKLVHPKRGVRFSPYAFVNDDDVRLRPQELVRAWKDPAPRSWGAYDGSGDPIQLTFVAYFARFVYDVDFARAPQVADNRQIGGGNTTSNLLVAYPDAEFVEFHFPGFDAQYEGMDWRSLRLVFVREDGRRWLVGIIHDEWTT